MTDMTLTQWPAVRRPPSRSATFQKTFVQSLASFAVLVIISFGSSAWGRESGIAAEDQPTKSKKFSPKVVEQAKAILAEVDLRQSGRTIIAGEVSAVARSISQLSRQQRDLAKLVKAWQDNSNKINAAEREREGVQRQLIDVNRRLAAGFTDGPTVARNNALVLSLQTGEEQLKRFKEQVLSERAKLNSAEAGFADQVLKVRGELDFVKSNIAEALKDKKVGIALGVMHANFETPESVTADALTSSIERRLKKIEEQIFSESIKMDVEGGSMYVNVVVDGKTVPMVVDSGASIVSLPSEVAAKLGVTVDSSARRMELVTADGRRIGAREVFLTKIRVGQFEATNVRAAVLDGAAALAEPLLGMSFLSNFKFEIDSAEKTLTLLRVATE